jgi:REP element-mobilizing transposase RayT
MDRILDAAATGPRYLSRPDIAEIAADSLRTCRGYDLHSYVAMANHVHLLVTGKIPLRKWLGPLKGFTAHEANKVLGLQGTHFRHAESYDHLVRNVSEFEKIKAYIEFNPVKAGIVSMPEEFRWSSSWAR